jgi:L-ascorbate metabolism protein UlaG (beta-lactamase superfamily)
MEDYAMQSNAAHTPLPHATCRSLLVVVCLLGRLASGFGAPAPAAGPCEPTLVRPWHDGARFMLAAMPQPVQTVPAPVVLTWVGHSSFLLTSPDGLRLLTDPNAFHPPQTTPEVVTVSNLHMTHNAAGQVPGTPQVLWGITAERGWNPIALTLQDVALFNVPSYASRTDPENSPIQNSIFVFRTGGLCLVHLGNLRHPLTAQQLQRLGKPDVVLIPADGHWTLSFDDVLTVIKQLQPLLVIPMHIETTAHAEVLAQHLSGHYPTRRLAGHTILLSRAALPSATEIVVFGSP